MDSVGQAVLGSQPVQISPQSALELELGLAPEELADVSLGHTLLNADEFQQAAKSYLGDALTAEREVALVDGPAKSLARLLEGSVPRPHAKPRRQPVDVLAEAERPGSPALAPDGTPQADAQGSTPSDPARARLAAAVRLLLNVRPGDDALDGASPNLSPEGQGMGLFHTSLAVDAIDYAISHGGADVIAAIFDPALEANGYISLSFAGLARVIVMASRDTNSISVRGIGGGPSITISGLAAGGARRGPYSDFDGREAAEPMGAHALMMVLVDGLISLVTEPGFVISMAIVAVLWLLWRMRRSRLEI